jgi:hypothetical protein
MGVAIYQAGHDQPVFRIKPLSINVFGCQIGTIAGLDNGVPEDGNTAIPDNGFVLILQV